jgi:type 1 glutamine amidotransferase
MMRCNTGMIPALLLMAILACSGTCSTPSHAKPLRALLVVTGEGHETDAISTALSWLLKRHDHTQFTLHRNTDALSTQGLQDTEVLVLFAPGVALQKEQQQAVEQLVQRGGGVVYLHTSPAPALEVPTGNVVVEVVPPCHPTTQQVPSFQITDAPLRYEGSLPAGVQVVARQRNGQPLAWVQQMGKGRVFATTLGHSSAVWNHPYFQKMVLNAVYWCAGRKPPQPCAPRPPKGFVSLFNGVNLEGWGEVGAPCWYAHDGVIVCTGQSETTGWLRSNRMYRNFILRLEYRISAGGNSGIFLRAPHYGRSSRLGMELQIQDDGTAPPSNTCTSAVYSVVTPRLNPARPAGEWNQVEVTLKDRHLRVVWNGHLVHDIDLDDPALSANLPRTHLLYRRPNWGYIGLQNHRSLVEFRHIFIKELD